MKHWPEVVVAAVLAATLGGATAVLWQHQPTQRKASPPKPSAPVSAPASTPATGVASFAIRGARVFDGERDLGVAMVVVRDGRIEAVGADVATPEGMPVVDAAGKTLLPGLIDAHVHAWGAAQHDMLRFGVTTGLDMHGVADRLPALKRQHDSLANADLADLWAAGYAITTPGGHGTQYGFAVPTIDASTDIPVFIAARIGEGDDFIKLIVEDLSAYDAARSLPTLSPPQVKAVIDAAHGHERLAVAHVSTLRDARRVIDDGADGLVHVFNDAVADDGFVAAMRQRNAFIVPTLVVMASTAGAGEGQSLAADPRITSLLSDEQRGTLARDFSSSKPERLDRALDSVRRLHAAGVDILAGSDAPNPGTAHGASLHGELALLVRAGLSPAEALASATSKPAKRFGIGDRGRIAAGQRADLVLVAGDPLADITATRAVARVWKNGHAVDRAAAKSAADAVATLPPATLVSDFDGDGISANFGQWQATTDQMAGGTSQVEHGWVEGGANGSRGALRVWGETRPGFAFPWAGVIFFPAAQPMQPVDASTRSELVFKVRGDGREVNAMLFSGATMESMPTMQAFTAGPAWSEVRLPLAGFAGSDIATLRGIAFTAGQPHGRFEFLIDDVDLR